MMQRLAPAKINLNLNITGRREDGYHLLDSIMVFTKWGDEINITPANELSLTVDGPYASVFTHDLLATDNGSPNLIVRAVWMMADKAKKRPDFHIHVSKHIPAGTGLGGGSSDAATIMHMLNDYWDMGLTLGELCEAGLALGAELPVCLRAEPTRVTGIGDILEFVSVPEMHVLIVWSDNTLLTKEVFDHYRLSHIAFTSFDGDWRQGNNDLTGAAIELCPQIADILSTLGACEGCTISRMSGSGSACFGVFETKEAAKAASVQFKNAIVTTTRSQA